MKISTSVFISFAVLIALISFLGITAYDMQSRILKANEYNDLMYDRTRTASIKIIDEFTLMQDIIEYNPDQHTSEEYYATYGRLGDLIAEYKSGIEAKGRDGQYLAPEDRRNELMGYAIGMETHSVAFNEVALEILAIREDPELSAEQKQQLADEKMATADESMWQFWYYLDIAKDTEEYIDIEQRNELSKALIGSNVFILIALVVSVAIAVALTFMTVKRLSSRIGGLKEAASRIARQNYSTPIDTKGSDEIASLAQEFEEMRCQVQETNEHLNELVAKRTSELEAANSELKRLDRLKDEFISIASHEMRNPIMPILGYVDLAVKGYMPAPQALERIKVSAEKLRRLTTDILDSSKIGSNNLVLKVEKASINELVRSVAESARVNPNLKQGVSIETLLESDIKMPVDKSRMTQVLTNLVNNAMKFTRKGSITLSARDLAGKKVVIEVSDTGDGIPADLLPRLFNKFVTKSNKEGEHGSGLGLYISKGIVEAHGGTISVRNNEGVPGCTFSIVLPVKEEQIVAR